MNTSGPTIHPSVRRITPGFLLDRILRLGAALPEQVGAIIAGLALDAISIADCLHLTELVAGLRRCGWVTVTDEVVSDRAFRRFERDLYRLTDAGGAQVDGADGRRGEVLRAVRDQAIEGAEGEADLEDIRRTVYPNTEMRRVREWVGRTVDEGLLAHRLSRPSGRAPVVVATPEGIVANEGDYRAAGLSAPPHVRPPRLDHVVHHLFVVEAVAQMLAGTGHRFNGLMGDTDLRSLAQSGRPWRRGDSLPALPDGRLYLTTEAGPGKTDIEILSRGYTDSMLRAKYEELDRKRTRFFATTHTVADRVERLRYPRPTVLDPAPDPRQRLIDEGAPL